MISRPVFRPMPLLLSLVLGGCSMIPPFLLPGFEIPATYQEMKTPAEAELPWQALAAQPPLAAAAWEIFALPELPGLLARLEKSNASLAVAKARYDQAAALIGQAHAGLFPSLTGNAAVNRARGTGNAGIATTESLGLTANWEIDLWGRLRAALAADEASAQASAADLAGVRLALQSQLVQALLSLRVVEVQQQLLEATVADYERYVQLTAERVRFGVASQADLAQAETPLHTARAQWIDSGVQQAQLRHALAVLLGELPANFTLPAPLTAASGWRAPLRATTESAAETPAGHEAGRMSIHASILGKVPQVPVVPLSAPSTLLERRPDIVAAAQRAAAANAEVGVAGSAFFPVLNLAASGGQKAARWGEIFSAPARVWSIGPALAAPLFDAGLRQAQKAEAVAAWEAAAASYRQTVLSSFQEVEDQLASLRILADEARIQAAAVQAARRSAELILAQYRAGTASSLQVIVANNALLTAERTALDVHNRRLQAGVSLIRALGGGWDAAVNPPAEG